MSEANFSMMTPKWLWISQIANKKTGYLRWSNFEQEKWFRTHT